MRGIARSQAELWFARGILKFQIGYFTVMDGSEADGDLVLIQTLLLYYVNQVILYANQYFSRPISITNLKHRNKVTVSPTFTRRLGY